MATNKKAAEEKNISKVKRGEEQEIFMEEDSEEQKPLNFSDYFNFSESYTSLILGIVVVIIGAVLMISFFKNRHVSNFPGRQDISATSTVNKDNLPTPTKTIAESLADKPTDTPVPTISLTLTPTPGAATPTRIESNPTVIPTTTVNPTPTVTQLKDNIIPKSYTVAKGDSLWGIAEKVYHNGYKWVDIARANNLANPGLIYTDLKLNLPQDVPAADVAQTSQTQMNAPGAITGTTYTIMHGDDLWDIAVRAYGDGYKWVDIAKANNLTNPGVIHSGNVLQIPR